MNVWHSGSGLYDFVMSCESMQTGHTTMTTLFIFHTKMSQTQKESLLRLLLVPKVALDTL